MENVLDVFKSASQGELDQLVRQLSKDELLSLLETTKDFADEYETKFDLYEPVPVAKVLHQSPARIRASFGGNRSSKTTSNMIEMVSQCTGRYPRSISPLPHRLRAPIFGRWNAVDRTNAVEKVAFEAMEKWSPRDGLVDIHRDLMVGVFKCGSKCEFMSYEQDTAAHSGSARHLIVFDEEPPKDKWDENMLRTLGVWGEVLLGMTPTSGMTWVYDEIYLKAGRRTFFLDGMMRSVELPEGNPDIEVFFYDTADNPHNTTEDIRQIEALISDPEERKVRFHGQFLSFSGLVYATYSDDVHVVDDFNIPSDWPIYCALDPHPRTEHAYLMMAVDPKGRKFLFDEFFQHGDYDQLTTMLKVKMSKRWIIRQLIDPWSLIEDQISKTSLIQELAKRGVGFVPASKDRARGILRVREALDYTREGGRVTKAPELYFFRSLKRTRWEIARYVWDDYKNKNVARNQKQTPRDKDDHMMENLYRLLLAEPRWFDRKEIESEAGSSWRWAS